MLHYVILREYRIINVDSLCILLVQDDFILIIYNQGRRQPLLKQRVGTLIFALAKDLPFHSYSFESGLSYSMLHLNALKRPSKLTVNSYIDP